MSNLKEIKGGIESIHNTQKTTNTMRLVSTAELKKAEEAAKRPKIYAQGVDGTLNEVSFQVHKASQDGKDIQLNRFQKRGKLKNVDVTFITADKRFYGGSNIKTVRATDELLKNYEEQSIVMRLRAIGETGIEYFNFQKRELLKEYLHLSSSPDHEKACEMIHSAMEDYLTGKIGVIALVYNGYKNIIAQELKISHLIPVEPKAIDEKSADSFLEFESEEREPLEELMKAYSEHNIYYVLVDSLAVERSARIQATDNVTNNAKARVKQLSLAYNKAGQESITTELVEIINGIKTME